jgi:hypothetical protein
LKFIKRKAVAAWEALDLAGSGKASGRGARNGLARAATAWFWGLGFRLKAGPRRERWTSTMG